MFNLSSFMLIRASKVKALGSSLCVGWDFISRYVVFSLFADGR